MASYCAKCGTELSPDKQLCPTCGAPAGSAGAGSVSPIVPPARSGNSALKIILIVVAVFVALGILGVGAVGYMFWRVAHNVRVSDNGQHVSLSGPGGSLDLAAETPSASELGTDIYPGAEAIKGGMNWKTSSGSMVTGMFITSDSKEQVVDFYKGKLGSEASVMDMQETAIMTLKKSDQESVMLTMTSKSSQHPGKTQISITHTTKTKSS
ncbi:MAG: zinc-ribbon domain-containing protein [Terracidiphilus sp.]|jgi:hypothetical protein